MNIKLKHIIIVGLLTLLLNDNAFSETKASLNNGALISDEEITVANVNCEGVDVKFSRGVRGAPIGYEPIINIGGHDSSIKLPKSCYTDMLCKYYNGKPAVVIIDAPACGGNVVGEEYIVIDLNTLHKNVIEYGEAKKANLID